jgi:hypothetical protein
MPSTTCQKEQVGLPLRYPCSLRFRIPCPQLISANQFNPHGIKSCSVSNVIRDQLLYRVAA